MESVEKPPAINLPDKRLLIVSTLFGIAFSYLVTKQLVGINFFIVIMLIYASGIVALGGQADMSWRKNAYAYLFTIPAALLSAACFIFSNGFMPLNIFIAIILVWAQFMLFTGKNANEWYDVRFLIDFVLSVLMRVFGCFYRYFAHAFGFFFNKKTDGRNSGAKIFFGILIGLASLVIILPLLISADENMAYELQNMFKGFELGDIFLYLLIFLLGAPFCFGFIWSLKNDRPGVYSQKINPIEKKPFSSFTILPAFCVITIVYAFFTIVQFKYLFSNYSTLMNTPNLTNSQYSVRGFIELIIITLLNFAFLSLSVKFTKREGKSGAIFSKILYVIVIAFNFVILLSSHLRLCLYEYSFGFTVGRFLPHLSLVLFAAFNTVMLIKVLKQDIRALKFMLIVFLVFYTAINYINIDGLVASLNINRYYEKNEDAKKIDDMYLLSLSDDALPTVAGFMERHKDNGSLFKIRRDTDDFWDDDSNFGSIIIKYDDDIYLRYSSLKDRIEEYRQANEKWQSFNISRLNAQKALEKIYSILQQKETS